MPEHWPGQGDLLHWAQSMGPGTAALLVMGGIVYLLWGWYAYKWLVTLNAVMFGAYFGAAVGQRAEGMMIGAVAGGLICAAITYPLMKYAVAVMGGVFGGMVGAAVWQTSGLESHYAWAGGLTGLVFFGMLSFIIFKMSLMLYTSLQGSVMLIFGLLGLIYKYQDAAPRLNESLNANTMLLPVAIFIALLVGMIFQQTQNAAPAGGGGGGGPAKGR